MRALRIVLLVAGLVVAVPLLLVLALWGAANTGPGQRELAALITRLAGGSVAVQGISGSLPAHPRLAHVTLRDQQGVWLSLDDVRLDWQPLALLHRTAEVTSLTAGHVAVARQPVPAGATQPGGPMRLPVHVALRHLAIARLDLAPGVIGAAGSFRVAGNADLAALDAGRADLTLDRLDAAGSYAATARLAQAGNRITLQAREPADGFVQQLAGLPGLPGIAVQAALDGPESASQVTLHIDAGGLHVAASGALDLGKRRGSLTLDAGAPAMRPAPGLGWESVDLHAAMTGSLAAPQGTARLAVRGLEGGGATATSLALDLTGAGRSVTLDGSIAGLRLPGPRPDLLAASPVTLHGTADLAGSPQLALALTHPLLQAQAQARLDPSPDATLRLTLPDLAPIAALGQVQAGGRAVLDLHARREPGQTTLDLAADLGLANGPAPLPALLGDHASLAAAVTLANGDLTLRRGRIDGAALHLAASGRVAANRLALDWSLGLPDLAALQPTLAGTLDARGHLGGPLDALAVQADLSGEVAAQGIPSGPLTAHVEASGLPDTPSGRITASGTLAGAPLDLALALQRMGNGGVQAVVQQADWKTAHAAGAFSLPAGASLPEGRLTLRFGDLADLRPFTGTDVGGSLTASLEAGTLAGHRSATLLAEAHDVGMPGSRIGKLRVDATLRDPESTPSVDASIDATGIESGGSSFNASLKAQGGIAALATSLALDAPDLHGAPARLRAQASINASNRSAHLQDLTATWRGQDARLLAPALVSFGATIGVDRLALGVGSARLEFAGRLTPSLDATFSLRDLSPALLASFDPSLHAAGTLNAEAKLAGTLQAPTGTLRLTGTGLALQSGPARALPPARLAATATLLGQAARIDLHLAAGSTELAVQGTAPLAAGGALDLHAEGATDLTPLDPLLSAAGRRLRGHLAFHAGIAGTATAPRIDGSATLADGEFEDFTQGVHITAISARLDAAGQDIRLSQLSARAGAGSISGSGSIGLAAPMPVDLHLTARNAGMPSSDRLSARLDADLALRGDLQTRLAATGSISVLTAEIRVPEKLPQKVVVLPIARPGQAATQPAAPVVAPPVDIDLDVTVRASQQVFVRGRGVDAELGGALHIGGTAAAPLPTGGFDLRHGTLAIAGHTLTFTHGTARFAGGSFDPNIDLEATTTNASITATLKVTGQASEPKITLTSVPDLPQDEILAQIFFGQSVKQLSPFQIAEIAAAIASFSGVDTGIGNPLDQVRRGLGLDQLSVGSSSTGNGATLQAGRYVANGVYVGAKQGTNGTDDTQGTVQIDITKGLKLQTDLGAGKAGTSVGLSYQYEW